MRNAKLIGQYACTVIGQYACTVNKCTRLNFQLKPVISLMLLTIQDAIIQMKCSCCIGCSSLVPAKEEKDGKYLLLFFSFSFFFTDSGFVVSMM